MRLVFTSAWSKLRGVGRTNGSMQKHQWTLAIQSTVLATSFVGLPFVLNRDQSPSIITFEEPCKDLPRGNG